MEVVEMNKEHISFCMDNLINEQSKKGLRKIGEATGYTQKNLVKISKILSSIFMVATKEEKEYIQKRESLIIKDEIGRPILTEKGEFKFSDDIAANKNHVAFLTKPLQIPYKKIDLYDLMPAEVSPHDLISLSFLIQD